MNDLNEIDWEAIWHERRKYMALLKEIKKKMQTLITLWRDCELVTQQRSSPSFWWQDLKVKVKWFFKPQYLNDWLDAIKIEFSNFADEGKKLQMIKTWRWIELMINGGSEPTVADTFLSPSLLNELNIVWQDRDWLNHEDTEDEMIVRLCRWRKSKHQQCLKEGLRTLPQLDSDVGPEETIQKARSLTISRQKNSSLNDASASVMVSEETHQFWRKFIQRRTSSAQNGI